MQHETAPAPTPTPSGDVVWVDEALPAGSILGELSAETEGWNWINSNPPTFSTVVWETSPDGRVWMAQRTMPRPFPLTDLQILLIAGKNAPTTPTMTAVFDNLWIERNGGGQAR